MAHDLGEPAMAHAAAAVRTTADLAGLLRALRRRHARGRREGELTYRELAARTGWSQAAVAEYFTGKTLPPTDRFDVMISLLGARPAEQGVLATARDRVEEERRRRRAGAAPPPDPVADGASVVRVVPRQLPTAVRRFVGRTAELAALTHALDRRPALGAVVISAICGTAGIGKTTLAIHWAHQIADRFPDGQLYANLAGFDPGREPVAPAEAIRGFLDALDVPTRRIPTTLDAQAALYRSLLAGRRVLLVLDNARDVAQVRPLLPGTPGCLVVITSRNRLTGLVAAEGAHPTTLDVLTAAEATELLAAYVGRAALDAEPAAVASIVTLCAGLPLALGLVAAQAVVHPAHPLATLAADLRDARRRLDVLAGGDPTTDVRAVFSWSHEALSPPAARLFRLLGLHPGPEISVPAAAALAAVDEAAAGRLLAELECAHLVAVGTPGRYALHDLLRTYAAEQVRAIEPAAERDAAVTRLLDRYLDAAYQAAVVLNPCRTLADPPGPSDVDLPDYHAALAWFATEHRVVLALVRYAATAGRDSHAWQLAWTLSNYLERRGHWHDYAAVQDAAVTAAERLADPTAQALMRRNLALACTCLSRYDDARTHLHNALELYRRDGERSGEAYTHYYLAVVGERQSRHAEALYHARLALELHRISGDRVGHADALNAIGWCHTQLGDHRAAFDFCQQALDLHRELGHRSGEADTWDSLGYINHQLGHFRRAVGCYRRALRLFQQLGDRFFEADTLTKLGAVYRSSGQPAEARRVWQEAMAILTDLAHPNAERVGRHLAGIVRSPGDEAPPLVGESGGAAETGRRAVGPGPGEACSPQVVVEHVAVGGRRGVEPPPLVVEGVDAARDPDVAVRDDREALRRGQPA